MASEGNDGHTAVGMEVAEQDLKGPSPSQSLLERLKSLREWQERQREDLLQVLSQSALSQDLSLTPLGEENTRLETEVKETTKASSTAFTKPRRVEDHHTTGERAVVKAVSPVVMPRHPPVTASEGLQALEAEACDKLSDNQLSKDHDALQGNPDVWMEQLDHPAEVTMTYEEQTSPLTAVGTSLCHDPSHWHSDFHEEDDEGVEEVESVFSDPAEEGKDSDSTLLCPEESPSDFMNETVEDLLGLKRQEPYRSEKYASPALTGKEGFSKVTKYSTHGVTNFTPTKSFFCSVSQRPEGEEEAPRVKHKFLRKGEGTSRFGMKPMRFKKVCEVEKADESNLILSTGHDSNIKVPLPESSPVPAVSKRQFRLPMRTLKVQNVPQKTAVSEVMTPVVETIPGRREYRVLPPAAFTQTTPTGPSSGLLTPRGLAKQQRKEDEELSAFEKLEEMAENSSFSSNSSTVVHLLKQGQQSISSTPLRTPPPLSFLETPVVESQAYADNFMSRVMPSHSGMSAHQQQQKPVVDVRDVLAQLKAIVRLEGHSVSNVTESDIQSLLEGCNGLSPLGPAHPTNITTLAQPPTHTDTMHTLPQAHTSPQGRQHHVHFTNQGVQVMEYEASDTEADDTFTDAPSLDSDLITSSDLEALTQLNVQEAFGVPLRQQQQGESCQDSEGNDSSSEVTLTDQGGAQGQEPVTLTFSPPPPRPVNSASNYIWSIFGKNRDAKNRTVTATQSQSIKRIPPSSQNPQETQRRNVTGSSQPHTGDRAGEELEIHKTLLLAKITELEKETDLFKKEKSKLQRLQQEVQEERQQLEEEKRRLREELATERRKFEAYVDHERNALWREKQQQAIQKPVAAKQSEDDLMEAVRLREETRMLQEEAERKQSLHHFALKKLNDKIKALETENKKLKENSNSVQALKKENQELRIKVDQASVSRRARLAAQPSRSTQRKTNTRMTTVDGVAKALDKMTKPQPVITKESQNGFSKVKQDLANNNVNLTPTESEEDVLLKKDDAKAKPSNSTPPQESARVAKDTTGTQCHSVSSARHIQPPSAVSGGVNCLEEAELDCIERVRKDGVREVIYANGNRKEIHPDGEVTISFYNGDRKEIHLDRMVYVYGSDHTRHTTYTGGKEEFVFPSGQRETLYPNGSSEISFPNGSTKTVLSDGTEISTSRDGSVVRTNPDGSQVFEFPSGQREVHRGGEKRREYPDGTVKMLHPDGRTETRYSSGRIRIKDKEGNVILDSHAASPSI